MSINLGTAFGKIEIDSSGIQSGMSSAAATLKTGLAGMGDQLRGLGGSIAEFGAKMTAFAAPLALAMAGAAKEATEFASKITNIGAVLGMTSDQMGVLSNQLLAIGGHSRAGPKAVASAFYDIAGGVGDASVRMDILRQSMAVSEAGAADLTVATDGMIAAMNAYSFKADKATFVADVYTQTVGKGVGTMDEFVAAMSPMAGIAAASGVEFNDLGSMMAFMTTKGVGAAQSATSIRAAIVALLNPNETMKVALKASGFESGSAALKMQGLSKTLGALSEAMGGSQDTMAKALGSTEALGAATQLITGDYEKFTTTFAIGLDGVTASAQAVQASSPAATFERLQSTVQMLAISMGNALLPVLAKIVEFIKPIIENIGYWIQENPELTGMIAIFATGLVALGPILAVVGGALSAIGVIIGLLASPFVLVAAAVAALVLAFSTDFMGIRTNIIDPFVTHIQGAFEGLAKFIHGFLVSLGLASDEAESIVTSGPITAPTGSSYNADNNNLIVPYGTDINTLERTVSSSVAPAKKGIALLIADIQKMWDGLFGADGSIVRTFNELFAPGGTLDYLMMIAEGMFNNLFGASGVLAPLMNSVRDMFNLLFGESGTISLIWDKLFGENGVVIVAVSNLFGPGGELDYQMMVVEGMWNELFGANGSISKVWNSLFGETGSLRKPLGSLTTFVSERVTGIVSTIQKVVDIINGVIGKLNEALGLKTKLEAPKPVTSSGISGYVGSIDKNLKLFNDFDKVVQDKPFINAPGMVAPIKPTSAYKSTGGGASFRDQGGSGYAGSPYLIGAGAKPELFIPNATGQFIPNFDKFLANAVGGISGGQGMQFEAGSVVINASTREGGMAAADGFMARLATLKGRNG